MYIRKIVKSWHYREHHEKEVPFWEVSQIIFSIKNPKRKENLCIYKTKKYYISAEKNGDILIIKSAKRIR